MGFKNNSPTFAQEQKVWLNPGNSGIAMASSNEKPALHDQSPPQQRGTPPPAQPDHSGLQVVESGLEVAGSDQSQVLSTGSSPSNLPYHHPQQQQSPFRQASPVQYAEQKGYGWNGAPPPQVVPIEQTGVGGYPGGPNRLHSASTGTSQQHQYLGGHNPFDPATGKPEKDRICGLKKVVFWGLLAAIIFAMVLALAIGLGVGLAVRNSSGSSSSSTPSSSESSTASSSATTTLPAATATATADSSTNILCPSANLTVYQLATATDKEFLVLCGRDYNSNSGAFDITSINITTFEGCLNQCGNTDGCIAVGYGTYYGTNTCWLKSAIGDPNSSADWYAAVEVNSV